MSPNHIAEDCSADEPWSEKNAEGNEALNLNLAVMPTRNHSV